MKTFLKLCGICVICGCFAGSAPAQTGTTVTGTTKTADEKTPAQAGLKVLKRLGSPATGTDVYGTIEVRACEVDSQGRCVKDREVVCGTNTYIGKSIGYVKGDGTWISPDETAGLKRVPNAGCTPSGLATEFKITLQPSVAEAVRLQAFSITLVRIVPDVASIDFSQLTVPVAATPAAGKQDQSQGSIFDFEKWQRYAAASVPQAATGFDNVFIDVADAKLKARDSAGALRELGGSGGGGGTPLSVREADLSPTITDVTILEFDQTDGFVLSNLGGVARVNLSAIPDSALAQIATAGKVSAASLILVGNIPAGAGTVPAVNLPATLSYLGATIGTAELEDLSVTAGKIAAAFLDDKFPCADGQILKKIAGFYGCAADDTGAGGGYNVIQEEGSSVTQRTTVNFIGAALIAADNVGATRTDVTLSQSPAGSASVVGTGRLISNGTCITGGGDLSADRTLSVTADCVTERIDFQNNAGSVVGTRKALQFLTGTAISWTLNDDVGGNRLQLTPSISTSPAGAGTVVGSARQVNTTAPLAGGGALSGDLALTCNVASGSQAGCLASTDWNTFNGKQPGDADLTSIAAISATGVLRNTAGTWTADAGISHLAASTSAQLATVLSDEYGTTGVFPRVDFTGAVTNDILCVTNSTTPTVGVCGNSYEYSDSVFRIVDNTDATKKFAIEVSAIPTATTRTWTLNSDGSLPDAAVANNITIDLAAAATALAADPANCSAGQAAAGITAAGVAEGCAAYVTSVSGTTEEISSTGGATPVLSIPAVLNLSGKTLKGGSPLVLEGLTVDAFEITVVVTDPTAARSFTLPNADSVAVQPKTCTGTDKVSDISVLGVVTCTTDSGGAGSVTTTGSPASGQVSFFSGATSITSSSAFLFSATTGHTVNQVANNTAALYGKRFTDSAPTGNFIHFQDAAAAVDLFAVSVLGKVTGTGFQTAAGACYSITDVSGANTIGLCAPSSLGSSGVYTLGLPAAGVGRSTGPGVISWDAGISHLAASSSADLRGVLSDENGTGPALFASASNPTFLDVTIDDLLTFLESAGDATCAAGDYWLKGNSTSGKLRGCENGTLGDVIGGAGGGITSLASQTGSTQTITRGAGIGGTSATDDHSFTTASGEADFLASGALTCGASTRGKMQVHTTPLQYCDNAATPALQYAAYGASTGEALAGDSATAFFASGTLEDARLSANVSLLGSSIGLTTEVTGILPGANGGTNNGFMDFTGPTTSLKTFTLPDASATILTSNAAVTIGQGGTGTGSTLTGLVRGSASAMTAAELSGAVSTSGSNTTTLATKYITFSRDVTLDLPTAADTNKVQWYFGQAVTITRVVCSISSGTNAVIQLDERAEATPNTAGTNVMTSNLTCDTTNGGITTTFTNATIAVRVPLNLQIVSVSAAPGSVRVHIEGTVD